TGRLRLYPLSLPCPRHPVGAFAWFDLHCDVQFFKIDHSDSVGLHRSDERAFAVGSDENADRRFAYLNALDLFASRGVEDYQIPRFRVGDQDAFTIRSEFNSNRNLASLNRLLNFVRGCVNDRDLSVAVLSDPKLLPVRREINAFRLDADRD